MNCYTTLDYVKSILGLTDTTHDERLLQDMETSSRAIDEYCGRFFYVEKATKSFSIDLSTNNPWYILLDQEDLLSVDTVELDDDGDEDYTDGTWTTSDYILYPRNTWPKNSITMNINTTTASLLYPSAVRIGGNWGYGDGKRQNPYSANGLTVEVADAVSEAVRINTSTKVKIGQTLLADSEQMFVTAIPTAGDDVDITVIRGVNGTTAASHTGGPLAYIYTYPSIVMKVCALATIVLYKNAGRPNVSSESIGDYSYRTDQNANSAGFLGSKTGSSSGLFSELDRFVRLM